MGSQDREAARALWRRRQGEWARAGRDLEARILAIEDPRLALLVAGVVDAISCGFGAFVGLPVDGPETMHRSGTFRGVRIDEVTIDEDVLALLGPDESEAKEAGRWLVAQINGWSVGQVSWVIGPIEVRSAPESSAYLVGDDVAYSLRDRRVVGVVVNGRLFDVKVGGV